MDAKSIVLLCARLSSLVYKIKYCITEEQQNYIKSLIDETFKKDYHLTMKFISDMKTNADVLLIKNVDSNFIIFRGTESFSDWITNFNLCKNDCIHSGFLKQYKSVELEIYTFINKNLKTYISGHSLGGALATVCAYLLTDIEKYIYTFGAPRVGNEEFKSEFNCIVNNYYRFKYKNDIVTMIPKIKYRHTCQCIKLTDHNTCFNLPSVFDHNINNYVRAISDDNTLYNINYKSNNPLLLI